MGIHGWARPTIAALLVSIFANGYKHFNFQRSAVANRAHLPGKFSGRVISSDANWNVFLFEI